MRRVSAAIIAAALIACGSTAHAGLLITVESTTIAQGQRGYVNVFIENDGGPVVDIGQYGMRFEIVRNAGNGDLNFVAFTQAYADDLSDGVFGTYVLGPDGDPFGGPVGVGAFEGGDSIVTLAPDVSVTSRVLLTRLILDPGPGGLMPLAGSSFTISLVPGSGDDSPGDVPPPVTFFADSNDEGKEFSSVSGTVRITAIPEPGTLALAGLGGLTLLGQGLRTRRKNRVTR